MVTQYVIGAKMLTLFLAPVHVLKVAVYEGVWSQHALSLLLFMACSSVQHMICDSKLGRLGS